MTERFCRTLIIGATFYGVSILMKNPGDCLLVDRGMLIGSEFTDCLNERPTYDSGIKSCFAERFAKELKQMGYMDNEGHIYSAPALFLFCNYLKNIKYNIMLNTEITDIQRTDNGYDITLFTCEGRVLVHAGRILDTTSEGVFHSMADSIEAEKYINFVVHNPSQDMAEEITYNPLSDLYIYKLKLNKDDSYYEAKRKIYDLWQTEKAGDGRIVHIASTFAYDMPYVSRKVSEGFIWTPSCGFKNILHAIDCGQECDF